MMRRRAWAWAWSLAGLLGCGDASLDGTASATASTSSGASESSGGESSTGTPPVEICDPGCRPRLDPTWSFQGEPGTQGVAALLLGADGAPLTAVQRSNGTLELVSLGADGALDRIFAPQLPCDQCVLGDMALHPSGDLILSVTDLDSPWNSSAVLARFSAEEGALRWARNTFFSDQGTGRGRAGGLAVLDDDRLVQLMLSEQGDSELMWLHESDGEGQFRLSRTVFNQIPTQQWWPMLAAASPGGELIISHTGLDLDFEVPVTIGRTRRLLPPNYDFLSERRLPFWLDDLKLDSRGNRLEMARSEDVETITLLLTSRSASDVERWDLSLPLVSTSSTRAMLAVGPDDDVYIAARTSPRGASQDFFVVELSVTRISSDGEIRWQASLPLDIRASVDPLRVAIDDEDGIVVATVVQGRLSVARFEQGCACE